jgi:lauroyl/myristoyl acyltransferase
VIESFLARLAFALTPALPPEALDRLTRITARLDYSASRNRRAALRGNLDRILAWRGDRPPVRAARERLARAAFESYHRFAREYLEQRALDPAALDARFRFHGMERLYDALSDGRGAVISAPHVGNWELGGLAMARLGFRVHVVTGVQFHPNVTGLARRLKERARIRVSSPLDGFVPLVRTLREGGLVVLLTDGDIYVRSLPVQLFGQTVAFPAGPALLARRAGAPMVFAHTERRADVPHHVFFDGVERPRPDLPLRDDLRRLTALAARALERAIAEHLDQWCLFRPFFRTSDAA